MAGSDRGRDRRQDREGFREGLESSSGDPRVVLVLNAVLSATFAWLLVWAGDLIGAVALTTRNVAVVAIGLFVLALVIAES
ncbi:hypothetical protein CHINAEXTREME_08525 [Halobiforma lacisalsi AJ5]|uniref:DUF8107 domain-containing protein n=1 Tax=Natronobacterium lacisalsi AJ5 TaxID=358396 RepID=M0LVC7_NATLA|nr:hypothetical protein [Halobiforma lacisalsi]APW97820.1 hypothetical protein CHINAEXTREME_08525 [Halobiforma lacisalsi AJ5]EMA37431.1 hypothetical protein C445_01041 [Halobiforma lacisalsi AJ5]